MARVEMKEIGFERPQNVVAQAEAQDVSVKRYELVKSRGGQHRMPHAERPGAETGDRAARLEWLDCKLGAMESLEPVADGIAEDNQILNATLLGERA